MGVFTMLRKTLVLLLACCFVGSVLAAESVPADTADKAPVTKTIKAKKAFCHCKKQCADKDGKKVCKKACKKACKAKKAKADAAVKTDKAAE